MAKRWWETREHETAGGRWVPEVHIFEEVPGGLEQRRLLDPDGLTFGSRAEAKAWSSAMAEKWLQENRG